MKKPVVNVGFDGENVIAKLDDTEVGRIKVPTVVMVFDGLKHEYRPVEALTNAVMYYLLQRVNCGCADIVEITKLTQTNLATGETVTFQD